MTNLEKLRLEKGLSRLGLAKASGVALSKIYLYESGKGNPTQETLQKLAKALDCDAKDLM